MTKEDYMRLSKERLAELLELKDKAEEVYRMIPPSMIVPQYIPPCYAPDGICTNPQMDCVNCPKKGSGSYWTTDSAGNKLYKH